MTWSVPAVPAASPAMPSLNDAAALMVNVYVPGGHGAKPVGPSGPGPIVTPVPPSEISTSPPVTAGETVIEPAVISAVTDASVIVWLNVSATGVPAVIVLLSIGVTPFSRIAGAVVNITTCAAPLVNVELDTQVASAPGQSLIAAPERSVNVYA